MTFDDLTLEIHAKPVVALFYGSACAPCERLKPKIRALCKEKGVLLEEFNSSGEMDWIRKLGIRSVPAVVVVTDRIAKVVFTGEVPNLQARLYAAGVLNME